MDLFQNRAPAGRSVLSATLFWLCGAILPLQAAGQDGGGPAGARVITLDDALCRACETSFSLQKTEIDLRTALRARDNLWSEIFPALSASSRLNYGSIGIAREAAQNPRAAWSLSAGLTAQIHAALPSAMRLIGLAWRANLLNYESSRGQLCLAVSKAFFRLLADERNLAILKDRRGQAEREAEQARLRFNNGLISEINWRRALLSVEKAKFEQGRAESAFREAAGDFLIMIGEEDEGARGPVQLQGSISVTRLEPSAEALTARFLPERPDIAAAKQAVERARLASGARALQSRVPSLSMSANYSGTGGADYEDGLSFSLAVNVPLEGWIPNTGANQQIKAADAEVEKALLELRNTETQARRNIRALCETLRASWDTIEIARLSVQIAERTYELAARGFREGAVDFLSLEEDRGALAQARQNLLVEELNYKLAALDLAQALNISEELFMENARMPD